MLTQYTDDVLHRLPLLLAESVQTVVTSPPYFGLRDYQIPPADWPAMTYAPMADLPPITIPAWSGCLGLEADLWSYVGHMVHVFRLLRPVLRRDGTVWLNLGDSYAKDTKYGGRSSVLPAGAASAVPRQRRRTGLSQKNRCMVPARVLLALQADGWYVRSEIIWDKPDALPEPVKDRPSGSHEQIYLLTPAPHYFFDADAIAEPSRIQDRPQWHEAQRLAQVHGLTEAHIAAIRSIGLGDGGKTAQRHHGTGANTPETRRLAAEAQAVLGSYTRELLLSETRNCRDVWRMPTASYPGAHHAVMPNQLADRCINAGSRPGDVVLDPFAGTGTVGVRALALGRQAILIERSPVYRALQDERLAAVQLEFAAVPDQPAMVIAPVPVCRAVPDERPVDM